MTAGPGRRRGPWSPPRRKSARRAPGGSPRPSPRRSACPARRSASPPAPWRCSWMSSAALVRIAARFSTSVRDHSPNARLAVATASSTSSGVPGRDAVDHVLGGRVDHLDLLVRGRLAPLTADQHLGHGASCVSSGDALVLEMANATRSQIMLAQLAGSASAAARGPGERRTGQLLLHDAREHRRRERRRGSWCARTRPRRRRPSRRLRRARCCRTIAPIPISARSSTVQPSSIAPWPTTTSCADHRRRARRAQWMTALSWIEQPAPISMCEFGVAAQHGPEPDVAPVADADVADQDRRRGQVNALADRRGDAVELNDRGHLTSPWRDYTMAGVSQVSQHGRLPKSSRR